MSRYEYSSGEIEDLIGAADKELFVLMGNNSGEMACDKIGEHFLYDEGMGLFLRQEGVWEYEAPVSFGRPRMAEKTEEFPLGSLIAPYTLGGNRRATRLPMHTSPTVGFLGSDPYTGLYLNPRIMMESPNTGMVFLRPRD